MTTLPLLSLARPDDCSITSRDIAEVWNAVSKAAGLVKDGSRLENLAWRHWNRHSAHPRRGSTSSFTSGSSISIRTPHLEEPPHNPTFGHALNLLLESDNNFKDWITEAKRNPIPSLSLPDTPTADVEIRLVEPTPVPSRVGSLGGSMATSLLGVKTPSWGSTPPVPDKPQGKFYLPSSPTKDSSEDDSSRTSDQPKPPTRRKTSLAKGKHRKKQPVKFAQPEDDEWSDEPEEDEGQKKREMFAKQQIFGGSSQGLLSGMFRAGGSMVDLTKAPDKPALRSCPTHGDLTALSSSPAPTLLRSKSAVAMPLQSGVSVTSRGAESFDEATDDDYLATSSTQKKLDELSKRRPVPAPRLDERGVVLPDSPTTRRRAIIMREMSESLRRNLILEREKSSTQPRPSSPRRNVLQGGFLRPLTRTEEAEPQVNRARSSANLVSMGDAPPMVRRSTEGGGSAPRPTRLSQRHGSTDTSYRSHGW